MEMTGGDRSLSKGHTKAFYIIEGCKIIRTRAESSFILISHIPSL